MLWKSIKAEMLRYDSCIVSDALEKLGLPHGSGEIARQATRTRIFGPAITVKLGAFDGSAAKKHLGTAAIDASEDGQVIVVEHHARADCAGWGGLLSTAAKRKGVAGVVVDGLARDIDESETLDFPVFSRGVTPTTARGRVMEIATNVDIVCAGIPARPGDYVLADGSGVAVIPAPRLDEILEIVRELQAFEDGIRRQLDAGTPIGAAMNGAYETLLNKAGGDK